MGLLVLTMVVLVAGAITPRVLRSDGLADFQGETRLVGEEALLAARHGCSEPTHNVMTRQLRVVQVERVPGGCPTLGGRSGSKYRVLIQRYTFFGIPAGMMSVCGDMGECWARRQGRGVGSRDLERMQ